MEATTKDALPEISGYERMISAGVFIIIAAVAISGNSLVILAVLLSRKLQTTTNIYVLAVAITDFLISIIQVVQAVMLLVKSRSTFLLKVCSGAAALNFVLLGCSIGALMLIAVNRMQIVTSKPSSTSKPTARKAVASIIVVYALNVLGLVGVVLIDGLTFGNVRGTCNYLGGNYVDYAIGVYIFCLLTIIIVCYGRIYYHVRRHYRQVAQMKIRPFPTARQCNPRGLKAPNVDRDTSPSASPSLNPILKVNAQSTSIAGPSASSKTPRIAFGQRIASTSVSVLELSKSLCERACRPEPGEIISQKFGDDPSVTQVSILSPHTDLSLINTVNLQNRTGGASGAETMSNTNAIAMTAGAEIKNIDFNRQEHTSKHGANLVALSCIKENPSSYTPDDKTLDGSKLASGGASFLNRSAILRTPSQRQGNTKPHRVRHQDNRMKTESRITFNMLLLVVTFFACMAPTIIQLLIPGQQDSNWIIFLILFSNCCWNPMIYAWKHPDFKHTFGCILRGKFSRIRDPVPWLRRRITAS